MRHAIHRAQRSAIAKAALVAANRNPLTAAIAPRQSYAEIELTELMCLQAFKGGYATGAHWNQLAECRNVLYIGAGHKLVESRKTERNPDDYEQIIDLCKRGSVAILAIRNREKLTGEMTITDDELEIVSGILATSAEFWPTQPASLFAEVVEYVHGLVHGGNKPQTKGD